jgi:microbial collagenase
MKLEPTIMDDVDGDGYDNDVDVFPVDAADWLDFDGDGVGDNADTDDDNDGVADGSDTFPFDATETLDTDSGWQ